MFVMLYFENKKKSAGCQTCFLYVFSRDYLIKRYGLATSVRLPTIYSTLRSIVRVSVSHTRWSGGPRAGGIHFSATWQRTASRRNLLHR